MRALAKSPRVDTVGWVALALLLLVSLAGCHHPDDQPSTNPVRIEYMAHLSDGRSLPRITAMRALAPEANTFEVHAIAKSAESGDIDVRIEAARALGIAKPRDTIDLLGILLGDPQDQVRAAAVMSLGKKHDPKADAYAASAYETGGPWTRAAVALCGPKVLAHGIAEESASRRQRIDEVLHYDPLQAMKEAARQHRTIITPQPSAQLQASMLEDLGRSGGPDAVGQLVAYLASRQALIAAGAAMGLANAGAVERLPKLEGALSTHAPVLAPAAAVALGELDPKAAADALVGALKGADAELTQAILTSLEPVKLTAAEQQAVCAAAKAEPDATLALALFQRANAGCEPDPTLPKDAAGKTQKLLVLAALGPKTQALLTTARTLVDGDDALVAASAATYLGVWGDADDGQHLLKVATEELDAIDQQVTARAAELKAKKAAGKIEEARERAQLAQFAAADGKPGIVPPVNDPLTKLLENATPTSATTPIEIRPGSVQLIAAASAGAARRGADVDLGAKPAASHDERHGSAPRMADIEGRATGWTASGYLASPTDIEALVTRLVAEDDPRLRVAATDVADLAGPAGAGVRAKLRAAKDVALRSAMALRDVESGRKGAFARLALLAPTAPADDWSRMARDLTKHPSRAKSALIELADENSIAALPAIQALAKVPGKGVDELLMQSALSPEAGIALAAVTALGARDGTAPIEALARAATHPSGNVRAAALDALASRHACTVAPRLAPLAHEFEHRVRQAARAFEAACAGAQAPNGASR